MEQNNENEHKPIIMMYHDVEMFERDCFNRVQKENNLKKDIEEIVNSQRKRAMATMI